ncbi:MAG: hypothetical protein GTO51_07725 [Candidatus Latescibacteria bacterium]|nr:hypothetical protein [Candidatus Latescibacterota bacterium]NIO56877.1 hypothetical protein [Candidatus Latescibacterota bacterium]
MWYRVISSGELIHLNGLTLLGSTFATALAFVVYRESLDVRQLVGIVATLVRVIMLGQRIGVTAADHAVS